MDHRVTPHLTATKTSTPVGDFWMIIEEVSGIDTVRASGFGELKNLRLRLPADCATNDIRITPLHPYTQAIASYFSGDVLALQTLPHSQQSSVFYENIWGAMANIHPGNPISYKQLATAAGYPAAVRAAGTACGQNRLILIVPCHRVIKSDGGVGSYLYGSALKTWLLDHEVRYRTPT